MKNEYRSELRQLCRERREILERLFIVPHDTETWNGLFDKLTTLERRLAIVRCNYDIVESHNDLVCRKRLFAASAIIMSIMFAAFILLKDFNIA